MSSKKRAKKGKPRGGAQLSGNPQRRAEQVAAREAPTPVSSEKEVSWPPLAGDLMPEMPDPEFDWETGFAEPGRRPDDGEPDPSWEPSHRRVIERVREVEIPESPMAIDSLTCELVGGAYWDAIRQDEQEFEKHLDDAESQEDFDAFDALASGFSDYPDGWLNALADVAALEVENARDDSLREGVWLLLRGMTAWAPYDTDSVDATDTDPFGPVSTATRRAGEALVDKGHLSRPPDPVSALRPRPTGWPSVLHDAYGSRVALMAPFAYGDDRTDPHWYCWDIDRCCLDDLVGAGVFPSLEDAVAEWRSTVGASALDGAEPRRCTPGEAAELLGILVTNMSLAGMRDGGENRSVIVEQFRATRRADELSIHFEDRLLSAPETGDVDPDRIIESFRTWYADRNGEQSAFDDVASLFEEWGPIDSAPPLIYACSPHRIRHAAVVVEDTSEPGEGLRILALLPEWVEWCIAHTGLAGEPADAARATARQMSEQGELHTPTPDPEFRFREL